MQLFSTKTSVSRKFDILSRLRTQRESKLIELNRLDTEIAGLEIEINEFLGNTPVAIQHIQPPATTQVMQVPNNRTTQTHQIMTPPAKHAPCQAIATATQAARTNTNAVSNATNAIHSRLAHTPAASTPTASNTGIPGMAAIINSRAPYHTEEVKITGVNPNGQIVMYKHYLSGDGISSGVQALEGCTVTHHTSKSTGKPYRQMETPALKITCTLTAPLALGIAEKNRMIREWMSANNWLTSTDPSKAVFQTDYDGYGNAYTPYVSIDTINTTLYIYIGCASMSSAKPCPTLIQ